jgi:Protein of unknown function (DUF2934)
MQRLGNRVVIGIVFIGVVTTLAVFAILLKTCAGKFKKAERWEKGEIIKQLLALSEGENRVSAVASPPARGARSAPTSAPRTHTLRKGTPQKRNSNRSFPPASSKLPSSPKPHQPDAKIEEKIRQRAYELYQERGGVAGNPTDDWLQAKQEVLSRKARAGSSYS